MPSGFLYRSGPQEFKKLTSTAAIITAGDAVINSAGSCIIWTDGPSKVIGVSTVTVPAAATATQIMRADNFRTRFLAWEKRGSGSLAATDRLKQVALAGATGAMGFDSSDSAIPEDFYLDEILSIGASNVGSATGVFTQPLALGASAS